MPDFFHQQYHYYCTTTTLFLGAFEIRFVSPFRRHRCQAKALAEAHVQLKRLQETTTLKTTLGTCVTGGYWCCGMLWWDMFFLLKNRRLKYHYCAPTAMCFLLLYHLVDDLWKLLIIWLSPALIKHICSWTSAKRSKLKHWLPIKLNISSTNVSVCFDFWLLQ